MDFSLLGKTSIATEQLGDAHSFTALRRRNVCDTSFGQAPDEAVQAGHESNTDQHGSRHARNFLQAP
jgi:hypothetical protein